MIKDWLHKKDSSADNLAEIVEDNRRCLRRRIPFLYSDRFLKCGVLCQHKRKF
ncbi:MAG: hypothetical protein V7K24_17745 [Nostoc sp.]